MASSLTRRLIWSGAAVLAFAFLLGLALHGKRPDAGMVSFQAAGLLTQFTPEATTEIEIVTSAGRKRFRRDDGWSPRIDQALRLLRDAGPLRIMTAAEIAGQAPASYGLDDKGTLVTVRGGPGQVFSIQFGSLNPLGSGRYARVAGVPGIPILPSYVADAWEQLAK